MDIAHVYWCIQCDTFEVFTSAADLFVFSLLISFFYIFIVGFVFSFSFFGGCHWLLNANIFHWFTFLVWQGAPTAK